MIRKLSDSDFEFLQNMNELTNVRQGDPMQLTREEETKRRGAMKKVYTKIVENVCDGCPNIDDEIDVSLDMLYCAAAKEVKNGRSWSNNKIPTWCPLPDYKEKEDD
jgi:hypothetical protein